MSENITTIFLADDNPENLKVLSDILEAEGYRTRASLSGITMLESIRVEMPDLIILDIHMPDKDGYDICTMLKQDDRLESIPVIFCSALSETFNIVQAFETGGVDYITKPFRAREVSARVRTHIELRRKQQSLETALDRLKIAQQQLIQTEKMTSLGTLVEGVAHEINNPVNYIINSLEAYRTDYADLQRLLAACGDTTMDRQAIQNIKEEIDFPQLQQEMEELLDGIETGANKIHRTVQTIRSFSDAPDAPRREVDPADEIQRAVLMVRPQIDSTMELVCELPSLPPLQAQPGRISQAVLHLLQNAVQALANASGTRRIAVQAYASERQLQISVADTGVGIPKNIIDQVQDPFFSTRTTGYGAGLGLPTAQHIAVDLGGTMEIRSEEGAGTTVTITLPTG